MLGRGLIQRLTVVISLIIGPPTWAGGLDDASAGLAALRSGDNDTAIASFSRAISSGALQGDNLELAYSSRGRAFLGKHDYWAAISDLDRARQMAPDDQDAQFALIQAIAALQPADLVPEQSAGRIWSKIGRALLKGTADGIAEGLTQPQQ